MANLIETEPQLEELLSEPTPGVIDTVRQLEGDFLLLGVGGKIGPSLARMIKRATDAAGLKRRVIGVSRFTQTQGASALQQAGVETIACDLLDEDQINRLPEARNVVFLAGMKFGSTNQQPLTWAMNSFLPGMVARKYRHSRMVAYSTGNIYGLTPVNQGGSVETDVPAPVGEYAMSCLGRERIFEYFSQLYRLPLAIIRLNYASELRYGVLVDIAKRVWLEQPVDLTMGYFNTLWQGDANAFTVQSFAHLASPPWVVNLTGPELLSVCEVAQRFGQLLNRPVTFMGAEATRALLSNARQSLKLFGPPQVSVEQLTTWIAHWIQRGGSHLGKPTHFESMDGKF